MPYLIDTDWAINSIGGHPGALGTLRNLSRLRLSVSWITVAELYDSAFLSTNPQADLRDIRRFLAPYQVLRPNDGIAEQFAEIRSFLRMRGQPIPDFDIVIAATALHFNLTLLTFDVGHFSRVPDLRLYTL